MKKSKPEPHTHYHEDGSVWARGETIDGVANGYWWCCRVGPGHSVSFHSMESNAPSNYAIKLLGIPRRY